MCIIIVKEAKLQVSRICLNRRFAIFHFARLAENAERELPLIQINFNSTIKTQTAVSPLNALSRFCSQTELGIIIPSLSQISESPTGRFSVDIKFEIIAATLPQNFDYAYPPASLTVVSLMNVFLMFTRAKDSPRCLIFLSLKNSPG